MRVARSRAAIAAAVALLCLGAPCPAVPAAAAAPAPAAGAVWAWGYLTATIDSGSYANEPVAVPAAGKAIAVASGGGTAYVLHADGSVVAWGADQYGQLGNGTVSPSTTAATPVAVKGLPKIVGIAAGGYNAFAIGPGGHIWGWGENSNGELANGSTKVTSAPTEVKGLAGIVQVVTTDDGQVWALGSNGTVWAIGQGYLGTGAYLRTMVPVQVHSLRHVVAIAASSGNGYALSSDGSVWAWGSNGDELGNGTTLASGTPVRVKGLTKVKAIAGGEYAGYALRSDGTVWAWGQNTTAELAHPGTKDSTVPVQVEGVSHAIAISADGGSGYAIIAGGTIKAWGFDNFGDLGAGTPGPQGGQSAGPLAVKLLHNVVALAAGGSGQYAIVG